MLTLGLFVVANLVFCSIVVDVLF